MAHPVGDAAAVEEFARVCRREANKVRDIQGLVEGRVNSTHWVGRRASRLKSDVRVQRGLVNESSDRLNQVARTLDAHAQWIRETIAELENLEYRIRSWAASHPPDPATPGPDASAIGRFPERHSFEWRALANRLWSQGAYF